MSIFHWNLGRTNDRGNRGCAQNLAMELREYQNFHVAADGAPAEASKVSDADIDMV